MPSRTRTICDAVFALRGGGDDVHAQGPNAARSASAARSRPESAPAPTRSGAAAANRGGGGGRRARRSGPPRPRRRRRPARRRQTRVSLSRSRASVSRAWRGTRARAGPARARGRKSAARVRARGTQPEARPRESRSVTVSNRDAVDAVGVGASRSLERAPRGGDRPGRYPTACCRMRAGNRPAPAPLGEGPPPPSGRADVPGANARFPFQRASDGAIRRRRPRRSAARPGHPAWRRSAPRPAGARASAAHSGGLDALNQALFQRERIAFALA